MEGNDFNRKISFQKKARISENSTESSKSRMVSLKPKPHSSSAKRTKLDVSLFKKMWNKLDNIGKIQELASIGTITSSVVELSREQLFEEKELESVALFKNTRDSLKRGERVSKKSTMFKPLRRKGNTRKSKSLSNFRSTPRKLEYKFDLPLFIQTWYGLNAYSLVFSRHDNKQEIRELREFLVLRNKSKSNIAFDWFIRTLRDTK